MRSVDVLNLEHTSFSSRDTESATLVCNYLRMQGLKVVEDCVFHGYELLLRHRPKLLYITGVEGADINVKVAQFAKYLGCKVVSQCGEGIYVHRSGDKDFLGNLYHEPYPLDKWIHWNKIGYQKFLEEFPSLSETFALGGSPGHDRYKILKPETSLSLPPQYKNTIGIGCWVWRQNFFTDLEQKKFIRDEALRFEQELRKIIEACPETYFLLKEHPGSQSYAESAITSCVHQPNVKILKRESIFDCIAASDIWITAESTTSTEAWLMGKQTGLLNPSGIDWPIERSGFQMAQPNFPNADAWVQAIAEFRKKGKLPGFAAYKNKQHELLCDVAGHVDGLNHVRTGNIILDVLASPHQRVSNTTLKDHAKLALNNFLHWHFAKYHRWMPKRIPYFNQFEIFQETLAQYWYGAKERETLSKTRYEQQKSFYAKNNLALTQLRSVHF